MIKFVTPAEAVKAIQSGDFVHLSSVVTEPTVLVDAMVERGRNKEIHNITISHLHTEGPAPYASPEFEGIFQLNSYFIGANVRKVSQSGYADLIPIFLSDTQRLLRNGELRCDVAMIQVSEPDRHGYVSLGTSVDTCLAAMEQARVIIACVNKHMPRVFGDSFIHVSKINYFCRHDEPLHAAHFSTPTAEESAIAKYCASVIEDGACLQMGIGSIPNAVLSELKNHKNLGVHTEMFADGIIPLVESGVINGANKVLDKGKIVTTFLMGSQALYDFVDYNPAVLIKDVAYTNDPMIICKNPRVTSLNSAIQIDITGQCCADSIGTKIFSGVGGQIDFVYGASRSEGGVSIIAMQSETKDGVSKIAPTLNLGSGVQTTRNHVQYVATEFGIVRLAGRSMQERAVLLASIAHPRHREELERAAFERFGAHFNYIKNVTKK